MSFWARTVLRTAVSGGVAGFGLYLATLLVPEPSVPSSAVERFLGLLVQSQLPRAGIVALVGAGWGALAGAGLAGWGSLRRRDFGRLAAMATGALALLLATLHAFCAEVLRSPASVIVVWPFGTKWIDPIWDHLASSALAVVSIALVVTPVALALAAIRARAGRDDAFRASVRARSPLAGAIAVAAAAVVVLPGALTAHARPAIDKPSFLIIAADTLRADRVHAKRAGQPVMPAVAALAARGADFRTCFVPLARTTESLSTILTGAWPQEHHVRTEFTSGDALAIRETFARELGHHGWDTFASGDWTASDFRKLDLGFDRVLGAPQDCWNVKTMMRRGPRLPGLLFRLLAPSCALEPVAPEIAHNLAVDSLDLVRGDVDAELARAASSGKPFLGFVFIGPTHAPFVASAANLRRFVDQGYRGGNRYCLWARTFEDAIAIQDASMTKEDLAQLEAVYDASARTFDDEVAFYLDALARHGLDKNTVVIVSSDHGTAFCERGSFGQGNEITSDVSNKIPLVVFDPRKPIANAVESMVRSTDIAPTILDLAGLAPPKTVAGVSLAPWIRGARDETGLVGYAETGLWIGHQRWQQRELDFGFPDLYGPNGMVEVTDWTSTTITIKPRWLRLMVRAQHRMVRDGRWKLVATPTRSGGRLELYDVTAGDDARDVAADHPEEVLRLFRLLGTWIAREDPAAWTDPLPPPRK